MLELAPIRNMHERLKAGESLTVNEQKWLWNLLIIATKPFDDSAVAMEFQAVGSVPLIPEPEIRCEACNYSGIRLERRRGALIQLPCPGCEGTGFVERTDAKI